MVQAEGDCADPFAGAFKLPAVAVTDAGLMANVAVLLLAA
jgi:hypothetical protein